MADQRITQLTALPKVSVDATDVLPIADISASQTKKVTAKDLVDAGLDLVDSGSIDLAKLDQTSVTKLGTDAIADDAITYAKIQNVSATDKILGRFSVGIGNVEEIACTAAGRALLDDASAEAQRATLGLGLLAVKSTVGVGDYDATSIATAALINDAVTYAKIQNVSGTDRLLGRSTAGAGDVEEITCTAAGRALLDDLSATAQRTTLGLGNLAVKNTVGIGEYDVSSIPTASIIDSAVTTIKINDLAVTNAKIANNTIAYAKLGLADGDIPAAKIAADSITSAQIANNAIGSNELSDNSVVTNKIANGVITTAKLADSIITTAKIDVAAVTYSKIQLASTSNVILGRSSPGSGTLEEIPCTAAGRSILDDASIADIRTTLGLGTLATQSGTFSGTSSGVNTGDQTISLTGDVTGSGNTTFTATIANDAVTYAKIQNVSGTDRILGRSSVGAGDVEEITCTAAGRALLDDLTAAAQRTTLGLGTIATQDASSVVITGGSATLTSASISSVTITGGSIVGITDIAIADGGTGASTASAARINLGLAIGSDIQAYDPSLQSIANLTTTADQFVYTTAADTYAASSVTAVGRSLLAAADASAQRLTLGLGTLATQDGTFSGTHSGASSGTNTGDQTITLTGDATGSGTGTFAVTIAASAVTNTKLATNAVTTSKILDDAVTASKLADQSCAVVTTSTPSGIGDFIGQQWININTAHEYTWDGTQWLRQSGISTIAFADSTPLSFSVAYPDSYSATITTTLDTQAANSVFAGPTSGVNATPAFRALGASDIPAATAVSRGAILPGTGLTVSSGTLNHSNSTTAGTYTKLTVDAQGHVTTATNLSASDIPALDTSKITSGTFGTVFITDDAVTGLKLANYSTAKIGEALPTADYIGQVFFNPLSKSFFLWDGNVWQPIGISAGNIINAGTYNANTNTVLSTTVEGAALGFTVGQQLVAASSANQNYYFVVAILGTGIAPAPAVPLAPPDLILSTGTNWVEIDVSSTYTAQTASNVAFVPTGLLGSTNVQDALQEVSSECRNADNITSGTLAVARGGTGTSSYVKGDILVASGTTALTKLATATNGYVLRTNSATATGLEWGIDYTGTVTSVTASAPLSVANGTTTPAISISAATTGASGVVQLTDSISTTSSSLAATATAVKTAYDLANAALPKAGGTITGELLIGNAGSLVFEGVTNDGFELTLAVADPTADQVITLPNLTGTVALTSQLDDGTY